MPKKTRKQKMQAVNRHHTPSSSQNTQNQSPLPANSHAPLYSFTHSVAVSGAPQKRIMDNDGTLHAIKGDIAKTLVLAGLSCTTIIALSFILH